MLYRRFGKTELPMPVLSFGFMRSMHSWSDKPMLAIPTGSQKHLQQTVDRALELGINHFETARAYGTSERQLGEIVQSLPSSHDIILQTKIQPVADPSEFTHQCLDSLSRLQRNYIDLLAIHGINDYRTFWYACRPNGCLAAARRLQKKGKIGHIGFSGHGNSDVILETIHHEEDGGFDYMNLHWYYIFQVNRPALRAAQKRDMGVFIISPTDKGGMLHTPSLQLEQLCAPLSPMLFNDLYCLKQPEIHTISVGAAGPRDFDEHTKSIPFLENPDSLRQIDCIEKNLEKKMREETGFSRPDERWQNWPPWYKTPGYVNIPMILWLFGLARGWGMLDFAKRRYRQLGHDMPWVPGCNASTTDRYDFSQALQNTPLPPKETLELLQQAHTLLGD